MQIILRIILIYIYIIDMKNLYEIDDNVAITTTTTLTRSSSNPGVIYTKFQSISVGSAPGTVELIVPDGEELVVDAYQLAINTKDI